ncbi:aluminum-activated malate transporter 9-like [Andrographis paniculata]|uniref:aluminum-activated malate transporter 9-like n=1 Tax=Andrographis paniculata TaxID=175694 RepID=UPI0021E755A4|nr:aluminum-activated malate transporter 9-like [Andrographis paniculata]
MWYNRSSYNHQRMNGKKGSFEINMPVISKNISETTKICEDVKSCLMSVWEFCKEDKNRVIFSLKVGFTVLLVSLLILCQTPYRIFGTNIIWSIITVAIMFEYTVGATFNRGFNRALGSLLAGILAIAVEQLALRTGRIAEPIIIGLSIFIVGTVTSFMKLLPPLVPYEYGFRVILFTYCLIIVSGYRMGNPIRTAMDRLYSIAIGGIVAVIVNVLVYPIWAGEQLHKELSSNFASVADALEECVKKYLHDDGSEHPKFTKTVMEDSLDEPAYKKCRSILNSSAKLESMAISAKWEPPHGRFQHFFYPWSEYVKVSAVLRYCAYEVMAIHGVLHSEIQAPYKLKIIFQKEIQETTSDAAELVRCLGKDMQNMERSFKTGLLKRVHSSTERLQHAIDLHSYLLTSIHEPPDNSSKPLTRLSHALSPMLSNLSTQMAEIDSRTEQDFEPISQPLDLPQPLQAESYHDTMRRQSRRLHSWPSREVDAYEEEGGFSSDNIPRMQALESTTTLSLATFTSLLIEFVARLDHLVEAVEELSKMAKFKEEAL